MRKIHSSERTARLPFYRILEQGKWWRTYDGGWLKLRDMPLEHVFWALHYLEKQAEELAADYTMDPLLLGAPDDVQARLDHWIDNPHDFIRQTEIYRSLLERANKEARQ